MFTLIAVAVACLATGYFVKHGFTQASLKALEAELVALEQAGVADAKAVIAAVRAKLGL